MTCINKNLKEFKDISKVYGDELAETMVRSYPKNYNNKDIEEFYIPTKKELNNWLNNTRENSKNFFIEAIGINPYMTKEAIISSLKGVIRKKDDSVFIITGWVNAGSLFQKSEALKTVFNLNLKVIKDLALIYPKLFKIVDTRIDYIKKVEITPTEKPKPTQGTLFQEPGRSLQELDNLPEKEIENLQSTVEYQILNEQEEEDLTIKGGQSYVFLNKRDAERFSVLLNREGEFPKEFRVEKKVTRYKKDSEVKFKFNAFNEYEDYYYSKVNNNKKSNLYNITNEKTGDVIAENVRVLHVSKDVKKSISEKYGLEFTPTKVFSANRSIGFTLYRLKPSKNKYVAQAKKYLYDALKFLNPEETNLKINLDKIEKFLESFPKDMWDYINTTYSPEDSTNINASISLQNQIRFELPKLGFLQEVEKITGLPLQGVSFKNYDRSGRIEKLFKYSKQIEGEWGKTITIDSQKMTRKQLHGVVSYYLKSKNYFKPSSEEENVRKYAEHRGIDYNELRELVFGDLDKALDNISYNTTGNSDTIELSKWRESIRNYDWQSTELFSKPYENFQNTVKERLTKKFKDKTLSNGISHLDYFFSGNFNWLNINFNNISGQYYMSDMETEADTGFDVKMVGFANPFELKTYKKPKPGKNFLEEKEVFNRLAAILHEPFHALHALSYGTEEELQLRKAFDNLYNTNFGREMMNQVFGSGYNQGQQISYDTLYKEFTAFATQLMLYPKEWITKTDLRSNDIYDFIEKVQTLQDKTYEEIVRTQQKIGTTEKTITEEEQIKLTFLEKLYNYLVSALNKIIPLSKKFFDVIADSKLVEKTVIENVFGETEETVTKTLKLPENIKKAKEEFLSSMEDLKSAINTLMQIDSKLFSPDNINKFFNKDQFNQEPGRAEEPTIKPGVKELFESNPELANQVYEALGFVGNLNKLKVQDMKTKVSEKFSNLKDTRKELKEEITSDKSLSELEKNLLTKAVDGLFDIPGSNPFIIDDIPGYASYNMKKFEEYIKYEFPDLDRKQITAILSKHVEHFAVQHKAALLSELEGESGLPNNMADLELSKITPQQKQQALQVYSQYLDTIFPDSKVKDIVYHGTSYGRFDKFSKDELGKNTEAPSSLQGFFFSNSKATAANYAQKTEKDWGEISLEESIERYEDSRDNNELYYELVEKSDYIDKRNPFGEGSVFIKSKNKELYFDEFEDFTEEHKKALDNLKTIENEAKLLKEQNNKLQLFNVVLNIKNPKVEDKKGKSGDINQLIKSVKTINDGVILNNYKDPFISDVYVVFEPEQIHILGSKEDVEGFKEFIGESEQTVESYRAQEQAELSQRIPNIENYKVNGKVDKSLITDENDLETYNEIYDKYDALITPLLEASEETKEQPEDILKTYEEDLEQNTEDLEDTEDTSNINEDDDFLEEDFPVEEKENKPNVEYTFNEEFELLNRKLISLGLNTLSLEDYDNFTNIQKEIIKSCYGI